MRTRSVSDDLSQGFATLTAKSNGCDSVTDVFFKKEFEKERGDTYMQKSACMYARKALMGKTMEVFIVTAVTK